MGRPGPSFASPDEVQSSLGTQGAGGASWCTQASGRKERQPGFSCGQMAAQLQDLRMVEAAKKEFKEYVRQQVSPSLWGARYPARQGPWGRGSQISW